ncbi:MAG: L-erythro-3,5-diaminohexanoate dehydrogenase [Myxococcota bacterium]
MNYRENGHLYGLHRVCEPEGALPQAASELDTTRPAWDNEIVIDVDTLNIDSASFHQIVESVGRDEQAVGDRILTIVGTKGKIQNPVTGSGGMLLGTVEDLGPKYEGPVEVEKGDRIATLVSLTLTPLELLDIRKVHLDADQVEVDGRAFLWPSSPLVVMPEDLPERLALSVLDVCGAPAQTQRLVDDAESVLIIGMGKSGMMCAAAASDQMGDDGRIYAFDLDDANMHALADAGLIDEYRTGNAREPVGVLDKVREMTGGELVDVVINTCNVSETEMSAILPCRDRGKVYFFNMATSFARAALGCEGVGKDVDLLIGNGYAHGHAELSLDLIREHTVVRERIEALLA